MKAIGRSLLFGILSFVGVAVLSVGVIFLATYDDPPSPKALGRAGGLVFYTLHHVGIEVDLPPLDVQAVAEAQQQAVGATGELQELPPGVEDLGPIDVSMTAGVSMLLGTLVAAFLLNRAGRAAGRGAGGGWGRRVVAGASVAIPYAALSYAMSLFVTFEISAPPGPFEVFAGGGVIGVEPSPIEAVLWPLGLGVLAGGFGGLQTAQGELRRRLGGLRMVGVIAGGFRMAAYGLVFGFLGLLVLAALSPEFTRAYFDGVIQDGFPEGATLVMFTTLFAPNMATSVLVPAMGGSLAISSAGSTLTLLSYTQFPVSIDFAALQAAVAPVQLSTTPAELPVQFGSADPFYFAFLAVPLLATLIAGRHAARRADAETVGEGMALGAGAGIVFALAVLALSLLAGFTVRSVGVVQGISQAQLAQIGPELFMGAGLALIWGVVGGAIGGAIGGAEAPEPSDAGPGVSGFEPPVYRQARPADQAPTARMHDASVGAGSSAPPLERAFFEEEEDEEDRSF
ncbi:MAG: hypothetical protein ACRDH6_03010 [Actinomycetota bacterium]